MRVLYQRLIEGGRPAASGGENVCITMNRVANDASRKLGPMLRMSPDSKITITNRNARKLVGPPVNPTVAATTPKSIKTWAQLERICSERAWRCKKSKYQTALTNPNA